MEKPIRIITKLARYKFLANSQFKLLGRNQSDKSLYKNIQLLKEKNFIGTNSYGYHPKFGRLEDIHFLKPKAEKYLLENLGMIQSNIKLPKNHKGFFDDYIHRKMTITCQLKIAQACQQRGLTLPLYQHYFERIKKPENKYRQRATKLLIGNGFIIPDSIFKIKQNHQSALFCLELHNGYRVIKIEQQLKKYAYALAAGIASNKYNHDHNAYTLVVFEKKNTLDTTLERLSQDHFFMHLKPYFLFLSYDDLLVTPLDRRVNLDHHVLSLPALIDPY